MILPVLGGPTGSGKTALTQILDPNRFEVVSFDSRQVYSDLPIGTTAPSPEEQAKIPHWLVGFLTADQTLNASQFSHRAREAVLSIGKRNKIPFLVSGTGFYLRAFLVGMYPVPNIPDSLRKQVLGYPLEKARDLLRTKDPKAYESLEETDEYRIRRALEVVLTGVLWSEVSKTTVGGFLQDFPETRLVGHWLEWPRETLYERINSRVGQIATDMLAETERVRSRYGDDCPGLKGLGYNFALAFLDGKIDFNTFLAQLAQSHRNYAKRQITWFKKDPYLLPISWESAVQEYTKIDLNK